MLGFHSGARYPACTQVPGGRPRRKEQHGVGAGSKAGLQVLVAQVAGQCRKEVQGGQRGSLFYSNQAASQRTYEHVPEHCAPPTRPPPGSASARQTTADVELGTQVPGRSVDTAMRTRTLTSDVQTIAHRSHPFCCLPPSCGEPRRKGCTNQWTDTRSAK